MAFAVTERGEPWAERRTVSGPAGAAGSPGGLGPRLRSCAAPLVATPFTAADPPRTRSSQFLVANGPRGLVSAHPAYAKARPCRKHVTGSTGSASAARRSSSRSYCGWACCRIDARMSASPFPSADWAESPDPLVRVQDATASFGILAVATRASPSNCEFAFPVRGPSREGRASTGSRERSSAPCSLRTRPSYRSIACNWRGRIAAGRCLC